MLGRKELLVLKCSRKRCGGGRFHASELGPHSSLLLSITISSLGATFDEGS
jgi:hypothetical protein